MLNYIPVRQLHQPTLGKAMHGAFDMQVPTETFAEFNLEAVV
jgi:hypothetical protein